MKQVMRRSAADNAYLHKDFHGALSTGLIYIEQHYGPEAVREYLWQFATTFYAPLTEEVKQRGLIALKEHFERIYQLEGGEFTITMSPDELTLKVKACPAVTHIRKIGQKVAPLFSETTRTVNEAICDGTPFAAELLSYDKKTGRSSVRFTRRPQ
jgi:hypothetical protein